MQKSEQREKLLSLYEENLAFFKALQQEDPVKMVANRKIAAFGNYDKYYEDRYQFPWKDGRVSLLKGEYFRNKEVLDIGCHSGVFTI